MFFIFGWGHQTKKSYGIINDEYCGSCCERDNLELLKVTTWFTLFFIPIIPTNIKYLMVCHKCGSIRAISKDEFNGFTTYKDKVTFTPEKQLKKIVEKEEQITTSQTEVQRNYWEELRKYEEEKNKQLNND